MTDCEDILQIVFLTQVSGILKPFAWILGEILNVIYKFVGLFSEKITIGNEEITIANIALCIILFTLVTKMLMLPLTIKQQKFTKLSSKMNPELTKIQQKYKGKKDEESLRRQQAETQAVYRKYGASPASGCLPLLISLPILFALYKVIYAIPAYVDDIGQLYNVVANGIEKVTGHLDQITNFVTSNNLKISLEEIKPFAQGSTEYTNCLIDILTKFTTNDWTAFQEIAAFKGAGIFDANVTTAISGIIKAHNLFGLSILDTPALKSVTILIPIMAGGFQFLQAKLQGQSSPSSDPDSTAAQTGKMMTTIMPIMSALFCLMLPIGVGIYWIATSVFTIIQTIFINKYLDKTNIDELLEKNAEKENERLKKMGVAEGDKVSSTIRTASTAARSYDNSYDNTSYKKNRNNSVKRGNAGGDYKRSTVSYSASSIAANAKLLARRNEVKDNTTASNSAENSSTDNTEE